MNDIIDIDGVECFESDGIVYLKLETAAKGLGFTTVARSGNEVVRWIRVEEYLNEIGYKGEIHRDGFIPENIFYRLAMKAKNEKAERFQEKVANEIIPSIRRHGAYITPQALQEFLSKPESLIQLLETLKAEQEKNAELQTVNAALTEQVQEWDNKSILNALMRKYATKRYNGVFGVAWNELYKNLKYSEHMNLKIRQGHDKGKKKNLVDYIKEDEYGKVIKQAVAMCEQVDIDTSKVINSVNMQRITEVTVA